MDKVLTHLQAGGPGVTQYASWFHLDDMYQMLSSQKSKAETTEILPKLNAGSESPVVSVLQ